VSVKSERRVRISSGRERVPGGEGRVAVAGRRGVSENRGRDVSVSLSSSSAAILLSRAVHVRVAVRISRRLIVSELRTVRTAGRNTVRRRISHLTDLLTVIRRIVHERRRWRRWNKVLRRVG